MKIILAPDSFKEALSAELACDALARGVRQVYPDAIIEPVPMADGGGGTVDALVAAIGGKTSQTTVRGPLGDPVAATWGMLGDGSRTAVLEMASASGLGLIEPARRNPMRTTTFGTGQLILAALDAGASRILVGIGGSATNDGGAGAAQAVGVRFLDSAGRPLENDLTGGALINVARIDLAGRDPRMADVNVHVACDVDNPLCGPRGAAAVYGPQKGGTPEQLKMLDDHLAHLADLIRRDVGRQVEDIPGAGAAGGLGAGLLAFFNATIQPGVELVMNAVGFDGRIAGADLIITGEGRLDQQSMMGKVIEGVGRAGKAAGVPVIALVGCVGEGADAALEVLDSYHPITPDGTPVNQALAQTAERLESVVSSVLQQR